MVESVRSPARIFAGLCLSLIVMAWSAAAFAQPITIKVNVTGPGSEGAYVDIAPLRGGQTGGLSGLGVGHMELEAGENGAVSVGPPGTDAPTTIPIEPGIYTVWVESGSKDRRGNYAGGESYVYVGKNGVTDVNFDLTGRPPVDPSGRTVFDVGQRAKKACNLVTYHRAINQLTAYAAEMDKSMADLQRAIDAYLRDGAMENVPEPQRTKVGGILLAGGSPEEMSRDLGEIGKNLPSPSPVSMLQSAYFRMSMLAKEKAEYLDYLQKLQPPPDCPKRTAMYRDALQPINVGPKGTVGCDAKLKQDIGNALGAFGGGASGLGGGSRSFGIGGGGGGSSRTRDNPARPTSSSNEPKISPDPVPIEMKRSYSLGGTSINFGTNFTDKGFWVSSDIAQAPCQGTFQAVYVQDPQTGQKAGPTDYVLTGVYADWKLTVHWTYDRYVNKQHVEHKEGGWQNSGREILGTWQVPSDGKGVWNDLGWSTGVAGAKGMGFYFPMSYADFTQKPLDIVVHVTNPDSDPVGTTGFGFETMPVLREAGSFGRAPRVLPKAPSQKAPPEMVWKTPFPAF